MLLPIPILAFKPVIGHQHHDIISTVLLLQVAKSSRAKRLRSQASSTFRSVRTRTSSLSPHAKSIVKSSGSLATSTFESSNRGRSISPSCNKLHSIQQCTTKPLSSRHTMYCCRVAEIFCQEIRFTIRTHRQKFIFLY